MGEQIAIDGKNLRGAAKKTSGGRALGILNVLDPERMFVLDQLRIDEKRNEVTGLNILLETLKVTGKLITIDAIGTQKALVKKILDGGGNYLLTVKGNQKHMRENLELHLAKAKREAKPVQEATVMDNSHGRYDDRKAEVVHGEVAGLEEEFSRTRTIARVKRRREIQEGEKVKIEESEVYYISNLDMNAEEVLGRISKHWEIGNGLHWRLDVLTDEDRCLTRVGNGAENLACIRKLIFNISTSLAEKTGWIIQESRP